MQIENLRIKELRPLISPAVIKEEFPITPTGVDNVSRGRSQAEAIIQGKSDKLLVVMGPCSIHDPKAALEYAHKLKKACQEFSDDLLIIMRIYFEKPRTILGWKGLINDPGLDGSYDINRGLRLSRKLLVDINNLGVPAATEFLDSIVPQYLSDLIAWGAIGARTTESQLHRELASGLSMPVGFKNGTRGNLKIAIDGVKAARHSHHFLSVTAQGLGAIVSTEGNHASHVILRGGENSTNYSPEAIAQAKSDLATEGLLAKLMVDCSHGNCGKDYLQQKQIAQTICAQLKQGEEGICGVMVESHLMEGNQPLNSNQPLIYGQSITDPCLGWGDSINILEELAEAVRERRCR